MTAYLNYVLLDLLKDNNQSILNLNLIYRILLVMNLINIQFYF